MTFFKRCFASFVMIASVSIDVWADDQAQSGPEWTDQHPSEVNATTIERCEPAGAASSSPSFASRGAGCRTQSQAAPSVKSPGMAGLLSIGPTLGGLTIAIAATARDVDNGRTSDAGDIALVALGLAAFASGPTLGHIYARDTWNTGLKVRLVGAGVIGLVATGTLLKGSDTRFDGVGIIAGLTGGATYLVGTVWEMATAPAAARAFNRKSTSSNVTIAPMLGTHTGAAILGCSDRADLPGGDPVHALSQIAALVPVT